MFRQRFHPYLHPAASVAELSSPLNFDERVEAYDQFNHHSMQFVGYLRQYNAKRTLVSQLKAEIATLERKMIETHRRMICDGRSLALLVPDIDSESEREDEEHETSDSEDITLSNVSSIRAETPPLVDLTHIPPAVSITDVIERVVDHQGEEHDVSCSARTRHSVANVYFTHGIRSRFYAKLVPCTLCEDVFREHYKCQNYSCVARICGLCLLRLESAPKKCPFCNAKYELPPLNERINRIPNLLRADSPDAIAPPAALSQEF